MYNPNKDMHTSYIRWMVVTALSLIISQLPFSEAQAGQTTTGTLTVDGTQRNYIAYVPTSLGENRPLLISCHGMNQDANYQKGMLVIESVADTAKFLTVFPNGIDKGWDISGDRDIHYVTALIDRMVTLYKIDRNRVYLSGFSMGGMFTYHAMNRIADKIAAFAPISGYPLWGSSYSSSRPVPIIHTHGTSDDVVTFSGVQSVLNGWIQRNGCPTTPVVTQRYRNAAHITRREWGPGLDGVEVVLMEMAGKGHWISNDNGVKTGEEIWRFCSRFSLEKTSPSIAITSPKPGTTYACMAAKGEEKFPDIAITANADDPNGTVEKVDFYDGTTLLATCTAKPYTATLSGAKAGKHTLMAVATDNDGETSTAKVELTLTAPQNVSMVTTALGFKEAGCVPTGWTTFDSNERRTGYSNGFTQGCRILEFTGEPRGADTGLYIRNISGGEHQGWAKFGLHDAGYIMTLSPGHYTLKYRICNWNCPLSAPVELRIEHSDDGESVAHQTYTPTVNIGNTASNSFATPDLQSMEFDITETGDYAAAVYTDAGAWSDCIITVIYITANSYVPTAIADVEQPRSGALQLYDISGRRIDGTPQRSGIYIRDGRKIVVK